MTEFEHTKQISKLLSNPLISNSKSGTRQILLAYAQSPSFELLESARHRLNMKEKLIKPTNTTAKLNMGLMKLSLEKLSDDFVK